MVVPDPDLPSGERVKIVDFGISKVSESLGGEAVDTHTNMMMGTPTYMSPEQCRGAKFVVERSDVYSLGVITYQMLAGRPPFVGEGIGELLAMHFTEEPCALVELVPQIPPAVASLVHSMLQKKANLRPSMDEVQRDLLSLMSAHPSVPMLTALCPQIERAPLLVGEGFASADEVSQPIEASLIEPQSVNLSPGLSSQQNLTRQMSVARLQEDSSGIDHQNALITADVSEKPAQPLDGALAILPPTKRSPGVIPALGAGELPRKGTTLTESASEVQRPPKRRGWIRLGIATIGISTILAMGWLQQTPLGKRFASTNLSSFVKPTEPYQVPDFNKKIAPPTEPSLMAQPVLAADRRENPSLGSSMVLPGIGGIGDIDDSDDSEVSTSAKSHNANEALIKKALVAWKNKKYDNVAKLSSECLKRKPKSHKCLWLLGKSACQSKKPETVGTVYQKLIDIKKENIAQGVVAECLSVGIARQSNGRFNSFGIHDLRNPFASKVSMDQ